MFPDQKSKHEWINEQARIKDNGEFVLIDRVA